MSISVHTISDRLPLRHEKLSDICENDLKYLWGLYSQQKRLI